MHRVLRSAALLLATCSAGGLTLAQEEPGEFHAFVWRSAWAGAEPPAALVAPLGGVNIERDEPAEWLAPNGWDFYVGHAPGRNDLYLTRDDPRWAERAAEWYERRDPALLERDPCLSDPATRMRLFDTLDLTIAARSADFGLGLSLGDEVGLTPWGSPSDVCRSEHCEELWEAWCARRGLEPGPAPLTDAARVALEEDELGTVARWLARSRFHQDNVLALLAALSQHAAAATHGDA